MGYLVLYISHVSKKEKKHSSGFTHKAKAISTVNKEMWGGGGGAALGKSYISLKEVQF